MDHNHAHAPAGDVPRDLHRNPTDFSDYLQRLENPERDAWQKPDDLVAALRLRPGQVVCDVGTGPGYLALRMARAVGEGGHVFAVDVEPRMLEVLVQRLSASGTRNVTPVLATPADPLLPPASCDLALAVNTFHHFPDLAAYLRRLATCLKPGGRIVNVDFHKQDLPVGPPTDHKLSREVFLEQGKAAGLVLAEESGFLPYQYFLALRPAA
jgi:ubiquinone/menaquinone biosynthesis C-methylase UbiE